MVSLLGAALVASTLALPAQAATIPATGTFQMTTAPGILPTWTRADIALIGIAPGAVITSPAERSARIDLPVVAKTGTANASAGGFRLVNTSTGEAVRCLVPTVDTRARLIDCLTPSGYSLALFEISGIDERTKISTNTTRTTIFEGMDIRLLNSPMAERLNKELDTSVFSASVQIAEGSLVVTRAR